MTSWKPVRRDETWHSKHFSGITNGKTEKQMKKIGIYCQICLTCSRCLLFLHLYRRRVSHTHLYTHSPPWTVKQWRLWCCCCCCWIYVAKQESGTFWGSDTSFSRAITAETREDVFISLEHTHTHTLTNAHTHRCAGKSIFQHACAVTWGRDP